MEKSVVIFLLSILLWAERSYPQSWDKVNGTWGTAGDGAAVTAIVPAGGTLVIATTGGIVFSTDTGKTWTEKELLGEYETFCTFCVQGENIYAATKNGKIFRSSDGCISWENLQSDNPPYYLFVNTLGTLGDDVYMGLQDPPTMMRIHDTGEILTPVEGFETHEICSFASEGSLYLCGELAGIIGRSTDSGENWFFFAAHDSVRQAIVSIIISDNGIYAASRGHGILYSPDYGENWVQLNAGLPTKDVMSLACHENILFVGTVRDGVFRLVMNEERWYPLDENFPESHYECHLTVYGNRLFAGTNDKGLWRMEIPASVCRDDAIVKLTQTDFSLKKRGRRMVEISSGTVYSTPVDISIYSPDGNRVTTLQSNRRLTQSAPILWDGNGCSAGMYFVKAESQGRKSIWRISLY